MPTVTNHRQNGETTFETLSSLYRVSKSDTGSEPVVRAGDYAYVTYTYLLTVVTMHSSVFIKHKVSVTLGK